MVTVNYSYVPGQSVWNVDKTKGVNECTVVKVIITVAVPAIQTIQYNVQFCNAAIQSATVDESTLYADIDSALYAYRVVTLQNNACSAG